MLQIAPPDPVVEAELPEKVEPVAFKLPVKFSTPPPVEVAVLLKNVLSVTTIMPLELKAPAPAAAELAETSVLSSVSAAVLELIATSKKQALRTVAILPVVMLATYLALLGYFRLRGGYRPTTLPARPL